MTMTIDPVRIGDLPRIGPSVVTLGVFDGVHRGHRHLLAATRDEAARRGVTAVALVFDPHPDEIVRPGTRVPRLAPPPENLEAIARAGVRPVAVRFDEELRSLPPDDFIHGMAPAIDLRALVMTPDAAFGRGRAGTVAYLAERGGLDGYDVVVVEPLSDDGQQVSSSQIRAAIATADLERARRLLGRAPRLVGRVVTGDRRGRELGFPTANLAFDYHPALPPLGIYVGRCASPRRAVEPGHPALVSVGVRPTFHDDGRVLVEVYLLDWDGDLYGAELAVELESRLREERRFASVDSLIEQMRRDEVAARDQLGLVPRRAP